MFGKIGNLVKGLNDKFNEKDIAEAKEAILIGASFSDGVVSDREKAKIDQALAADSLLRKFDLTDKKNRIVNLYSVSTGSGENAVLTELGQIRSVSEPVRIEILEFGKAIASADGSIHPQARAFLGRAAEAMGLTLRHVGL